MKVSRPVIYALVAGVAIYAVVLLTEPDTPTRKKTTTTRTSGPKAPDGFLPEDLTATFPRYVLQKPDPFQPQVISTRAAARSVRVNVGRTAPAGLLNLPGGKGSWRLTGISAINGVPSALIEDGKPEDSVSLSIGQSWQGLRVAAIDYDSVVFENALGQRTRLPFIDPDVVPDVPPGTPAGAPTTLPALPGLGRSTTTITIPANGSSVPTKILSGPGVNAPATVIIQGNQATVQPPAAPTGRRARNTP